MNFSTYIIIADKVIFFMMDEKHNFLDQFY